MATGPRPEAKMRTWLAGLTSVATVGIIGGVKATSPTIELIEPHNRERNAALLLFFHIVFLFQFVLLF